MTHRLRLASLALTSVLLAHPAGAAASFDGFWKTFRAAVVRGDKATITRLTRLPFYYETSITAPADLKPALDALFDAKTAACFARAKPLQDGGYRSVQCGGTVYGFDANEGSWQFTGIGAKN